MKTDLVCHAVGIPLGAHYNGIVSGWKDWVLTCDLWGKRGKAANYGCHVIRDGGIAQDVDLASKSISSGGGPT